MTTKKYRFARIPSDEMTSEYEKKRYIFLMLYDSYESIYGGINEAELSDTTPKEDDKSEFFYQEISMMYSIKPPESGNEPIWATVNRIYEKHNGDIITSDDFLNE